MAKATKKQVLGRGLSALLSDTKEDIVSVRIRMLKNLLVVFLKLN